jgi:hypothetical protein
LETSDKDNAVLTEEVLVMAQEFQILSSWATSGYLSSMALFANGSKFGFDTLIAPEIGWNSRYYQDSRNSYGIQFRVAPLTKFSLDTGRT